MRDKYYKFDRVYNLFKDLKDKDEIRRKLDNELYKRPLTFANFRDYEYAYAYVYLLEDYEKARELLTNDIEYRDCKLEKAYAVEAILGDLKMVREILEEAEQIALEDYSHEPYFDDFDYWEYLIIAWKELLDDDDDLARCIRHLISRYRRGKNICDILSIAKAYKHLGDTTQAMYYMDYACYVAQNAWDEHHIADCWAVAFNDYEKCKLWSAKAIAENRSLIKIELTYSNGVLVYDPSYFEFCDMVYQHEAKAITTMDWVECLKLWNMGHNLWHFDEKEDYCLAKALEAVTHPQHYVYILDQYRTKTGKCLEHILEAMETLLEQATQNNIPKEHLGFLWLDCAEGWKALFKMERAKECNAKSDVKPEQRTQNEIIRSPEEAMQRLKMFADAFLNEDKPPF